LLHNFSNYNKWICLFLFIKFSCLRITEKYYVINIISFIIKISIKKLKIHFEKLIDVYQCFYTNQEIYVKNCYILRIFLYLYWIFGKYHSRIDLQECFQNQLNLSATHFFISLMQFKIICGKFNLHWELRF
jgi:hypothetical protein